VEATEGLFLCRLDLPLLVEVVEKARAGGRDPSSAAHHGMLSSMVLILTVSPCTVEV